MSETTINLQKLVAGETINITKNNPQLKKINFGLSWDSTSDVDAFCFGADASNKFLGKEYLCYFNQVTSFNGAVKHSGDVLDGTSVSGDDETITVDFTSVPAECTKLYLAANIFSGSTNFGQVKDAKIRAYNPDTQEVLCTFNLSEDYSRFNGVVFGEFYRHENDWKFRALGEGKNGNLVEIAESFGSSNG